MGNKFTIIQSVEHEDLPCNSKTGQNMKPKKECNSLQMQVMGGDARATCISIFVPKAQKERRSTFQMRYYTV